MGQWRLEVGRGVGGGGGQGKKNQFGLKSIKN
jgi:hypothetical protein